MGFASSKQHSRSPHLSAQEPVPQANQPVPKAKQPANQIQEPASLQAKEAPTEKNQNTCVSDPSNFNYFHEGDDFSQFYKKKMGKRQSPIDIHEMESRPEDHFRLNIEFLDKPITVKCEYVKTTFKVTSSEPFGTVTLRDRHHPHEYIYDSISLHYHLPSEHEIEGEHLDAEMHIVFKIRDETIKFNNKFTVIGVLLKADDERAVEGDRKFLTSFHPDQPKSETVINFKELFTKIMSKDEVFFHYDGSLTTPPCTENVNWLVVHDAFLVKHEDLQFFKGKWMDDVDFSGGHGNERHVYDMMGRKLYLVRNSDKE